MDAKLEKVLRLYRSTTHSGEKQNARRIAEAMLAGSGMSFDAALMALDRPEQAPNDFPDFSDWMEDREPGWKAKRAAEKAEEQRQFAQRRDDLIRRYGSIDAAKAPTPAEQAIFDAVARWRIVENGETVRIKGYDDFTPLPDHIREALRDAWPWPTTYREALAEQDMWSDREDDFNAIFRETMERPLDFAVELRARMIRDLVDHKMPALTPDDILHRLKRYRALGHSATWHTEMLDAIERDLEALAAVKPEPSASVHAMKETVDDLLRADPSRSDRDIARQFGCSPTTVGKARARLDLKIEERSVQRGGQIYRMRNKRVSAE